MRTFEPLFRNPHLSTICANFWPRKFDFSPFPESRNYVRTEPDTQVLVVTNQPAERPAGEIVMVHGLEGGAHSGYMKSLAWTMLRAGFVTHRFHMRTCGGTGKLTPTLYHGGLTSDLRYFLECLHRARTGLPVYLAGFSLGGNVALKLAGELGETELIAGVCGVSVPIDLAAGVERMAKLDNRIYERRFLRHMRRRLIATGRYTQGQLRGAKSLYAIDDLITAPSFGFESADHYYATQSSNRFLEHIRTPALLLQSRDDTFVPFSSYSHPALASNPYIRVLVTEYGGHLGHLARRGHRFWIDDVVSSFVLELQSTLMAALPQPL